MKTMHLNARAALVSLLMFLVFLGAWQLSATAPSVASVASVASVTSVTSVASMTSVTSVASVASVTSVTSVTSTEGRPTFSLREDVKLPAPLAAPLGVRRSDAEHVGVVRQQALGLDIETAEAAVDAPETVETTKRSTRR